MAGYHNADATVSARKIVSVTASDATILAVTRALWVGTGGNVAVRDSDGNTVTITNVPSGSVLPVQVDKVMSTNTTASGILAFY